MNFDTPKMLASLFAIISISMASPLSAQSLENSPLEELRSEPNSEKEPSNDQDISEWDARLELARVLSYMGRYDESLREYQQLIQEKPNSFIARREMAAVLFYAGKTNEAMQEFQQIPEQERDDKTWLVIADIFVKQKNYPLAERIYLHYLEKEPKDDKVRLKLAGLLSWEKRYNESIHQYQMILDHRPNDLQVRRRYAQVLTWMGNDEAAVQEWKKTLQ